ncbi:MAG: hypothetical protein LLF98_07930 [Clostridium sp.]|uniref:hypothetical protein n=1 Tax=Clostridium sp. TaxID=1506 RepID=UPI0025C502A9|nr:hypothetical protein [Clostridium sp.]MCE5221184.1 hypothetical protein [Clostridium sp.]
MSKDKNTAYEYFILSIQEHFKDEHYRLENRKVDSLRRLLSEYINLEQEIKSNIVDKDKLQKSKKALNNTIIFYFEKTLFKKNESFSNDIVSLLKLMKSENKSDKDNQNESEKTNSSIKKEECIYYSISALNKKISKINILNFWIDIILEKVSSFEEVDKVMDCYISELLYEGYSLKYLQEWWMDSFKEILNKKQDLVLESEIEKFKVLSDKTTYEYDVIIKLSLPQKIKDEFQQNNHITIGDITYTSLDEEEKETISKENYKFFESNKVWYLKIRINACDKYKAIEQVLYPIENYIEIYKVLDNTMSNTLINTCLIKVIRIINEEIGITGGGYKEISLNNIKQHTKEFSEREKEDIEDFVNLRDDFRHNKKNMSCIHDMEQVINILQKSTEFTRENRLLNYWNCMENLLRPYKGNSIIEKVITIVPKVICIYIVKQKMNVLWERLYPLLGKKIDDKGIGECKSEDKPHKYSKKKLVEYLACEETSNNLNEKTKCYTTVNRSVTDVHKLLTEPSQLLKYIEDIEQSVINSITSVYRTRNNLVHNGGSLEINMQYQTDRLQHYLSCILSTLIYHIKRNPELSVGEVLYSIIQTYDTYKEGIKNLSETVKKIEKKYNNNTEEGIKELIKNREKEILEFGLENIAFIKYLYI